MKGDERRYQECERERRGGEGSNVVKAFLMMVFGLSSAIWWAISSSIMFKQLQNHMVRKGMESR